MSDPAGHCPLDTEREGRKPLVRRHSRPPKCQSDVRIPMRHAERRQVTSNGRLDDVRVDVVAELVVRPQHLQIAPRQQAVRVGDKAGVAAELHAELRRSQHGRPDALAGGQQPDRERSGGQAAPDRRAQAAPEVPEVPVLAFVHILGHPS